MLDRVRGRRPAWAVVTAVLLPLLLSAAPGPPGAAMAAPGPSPEVRPVRIVVLVDESGSMSTKDIARERDAARVIAQGEPSPRSTVSVVGFASADASGQSPVDPVCPPTTLDTPQKHQTLAECVGGIHGRGKTEGDGTDHVTALRTALDYLDAPGDDGQAKLVYLLTDGKLDVSGSPAYGADPVARETAARQQIPGLLDELNHDGVAVWPLGFGQADRAQLDGFATGAAQDGCGARTPRPHATVITSSADLLRAIGAASRAARCASVSDPVNGNLPEGGSVDLDLDIPAIASEGSILVYKRDPRVTVGYLDPEGVPVPANATLGASRFELSGQSTEAEALHIVNPEPGKWTVRLSAPPGVPAQDVAAVASFQGAIRAVIGVVPPSPRPGSTVEVSMQVRGSRGAITDPAQLRGLTFTAGLSGEGFPPVPPVELADDDGHGQYQARLAVPSSASGRLDFVGSVTGAGVSGDRRPLPTRISRGGADLAGVLNLDGTGSEVTIGDSLQGTANVTNSTGQPRTLRLEVADQSPGAVISAGPARLQVPAAGNAALPFTLRFDPATALGTDQARLRLVDDADGTLVGELLFAREVVPEPTFFQRFWWLFALLAAALAGGAFAVFRRVWLGRAARDVRGVRVELLRHGQALGSLQARQSTEEFRFSVRDSDGAGAGLTTGGSGEQYRVRRALDGPTLRGPAGLATDGKLELGDHLVLLVHDRPAPARRKKPPRHKEHTQPRPKPAPEDPYANA